MQTVIAEATLKGNVRWGMQKHNKESVYPRWFLTAWNSRKIHIKVKEWATVDACGYVHVHWYVLQDKHGSADFPGGRGRCQEYSVIFAKWNQTNC